MTKNSKKASCNLEAFSVEWYCARELETANRIRREKAKIGVAIKFLVQCELGQCVAGMKNMKKTNECKKCGFLMNGR